MITPLIVGLLFNRLDIGILASSGALVAGIGDNPGYFRIKLYTQLIGAVFYFLVVVASQLLLPYIIPFGIWITFCGFFFSMFFIYGSRAVSVSTASLLCIVYADNFQHHNIVTNTAGMMAGVLFYGIISLGLWRIQPYRVIEQKLSENIKQLSEYIDLLYEYFLLKSENPDKKQKQEEILARLFEKQEKIHSTHEDIRENLFKLRINAKSFSAKGRRMTLLFSALIDLYEQLISLNVQDDKLVISLDKSNLKEDFCFCLSDMRDILNELSWSINLHKKVQVEIDSTIPDSFKKRILELEEEESIDNNNIDINALKHIRFIFQSFYKQARIVKSIINGKFSTEENRYEDLDLGKFTQQYNYNFSTLKANLNLRSNIFRHALRVGFAILLAYIVCTLLKINYFSWVFLTIILILKPVYGNTKSFSIQRLQGTLIGGAIIVLILLLTQNVYIISVLTVLCIIGAYSFIPINYRVGVVFVTIFVILLIFLEHRGTSFTNVYHRLGGTAIAIAIAFILSFSFLPTWEYKVLPQLIGKLLNYNLKYFEKISFNLLNEEKLSDTNLKLSRKDVLLGTSNLSGAFQRIVSEPRLSKEYKSDIYNIQTLINLLSTRISSLRAYTITSQVSEITETDKQLIRIIEDTFCACILTIREDKAVSENTWKEEEFFLPAEDQSLVTYQLREINTLVQQIYKYILKLRECQEWKNSKREFSFSPSK